MSSVFSDLPKLTKFRAFLVIPATRKKPRLAIRTGFLCFRTREF